MCIGGGCGNWSELCFICYSIESDFIVKGQFLSILSYVLIGWGKLMNMMWIVEEICKMKEKIKNEMLCLNKWWFNLIMLRIVYFICFIFICSVFDYVCL